MKIVVLGGAGDMGSRAVEVLAATPDVQEVTIADRDVDGATRLADRIGGQGARVRVRSVDASDHSSLVRALSGHDVAASALGPFYRFEVGMVRAAIDAGVDYTSICDEWNPLEQVLDELDGPARDAGRTIVCGLGTSPGITNVGIRYYADRMDRVERVRVTVYQPLDAGGGEAVLRHMLFIMSGDVAVWRHGRRQLVPACGESQEVELPGAGLLRVWNMGHGEPVTVPRYIQGLKEVGFFMGYGRGSWPLVTAARYHLFAGRRRANAAVRLLSPLERLTKDREPSPGAVRMDVWGEEGGAAVHRMACGVGTMREATALSLVVGTLMLARREGLTRRGGAFAPEACLDPERFLTDLAALGIVAYEDLEMRRPVIVAPADA